jgi:hypothetical protein
MPRPKLTKRQLSATRRAAALSRWANTTPAQRSAATAPAVMASPRNKPNRRFCADVQCSLPADHQGPCIPD